MKPYRLIILPISLFFVVLAYGCTDCEQCISREDIVELYVNLNVGETSEFEVIDTEGKKLPSLVLDSGTVLVVTDVLVTPNVEEGFYFGNVNSPRPDPPVTTENRIRLLLNTDSQAMLHLPLTTGVVFNDPPVAFSAATNPGGMVVRLLGYIATETTP